MCVWEEGLTTDVVIDPTYTLELPKDRVCYASKRSLEVGWFPRVDGCWTPVVHRNCYHNEVQALKTRSLKQIVLPFEAGLWGRHKGGFRKLIASYQTSADVGPWDLERTAMSYSGRLRKRYVEAWRSLVEDGGVTWKDARLKGFLKAEKRAADNVVKPRMIFPRDPRYNLSLAKFLKPFEHWLWPRLTTRAFGGRSRLRVCGKGLNQVERAALIRKKMEFVGDCVVFEVDGKAFEAHVNKEMLAWEHGVYLHAYRGNKELAALLRQQRVNKGVTQMGVKFVREAGRASGDFNTGMGNTLIMCHTVAGCLRALKCRWDILVDGDNAVLFVPRSRVEQARRFMAERSVRYGHEITLEKPTDIYERVIFGQSQPVFFNGRYAMVRDYRKVISNFGSSHVHMKNAGWREYVRAVAVCEQILSNGLPVMGPCFSSIAKHLDSPRSIRSHLVSEYAQFGIDLNSLRLHGEITPCQRSRASFELAFGLSPEEQRAIEGEDWADYLCK